MSGLAGDVSILVPCERHAKVEDLINKARGRLERAGVAIYGRQMVLRLGTVDGPFLDGDDALELVVLDPSRERLFVSFLLTDFENFPRATRRWQPCRPSGAGD
jgi:hypothetical protein